MALQAERIEVGDSWEEVNSFFCKNEWSDGLPIVPPTEERVLKMLAGTSRKHDELIGTVPPRWAELRVEDVAINAVMAGCLPEYMPVIITAMEAMLEPQFDLYAVQATTHPATPLVIVNGPIAKKLNMNSGSGVFGPGWRANATIGRAIRLILWNVGGGVAGKGDMCTQGRPSKYTYCIAENEDENPWEPLHVEKGLSRDKSAVTVFACDNPHNINEHVFSTGVGILTTVTSTIANVGATQPYVSNNDLFLVLGPEHAATIAQDGLSKDDVKKFIQQYAQLPFGLIKNRSLWGMGLGKWPKWFNTLDDSALIPIVQDWHRVAVVVAGGPGKQSCWLPAAPWPAVFAREIKA